MDTYLVRRCRPDEARGSVEELWQRNLTLEQSPAAKFSWLYEQAPEKPEALFVLDAQAAGAPPRPVGTAGVGIRIIAAGDHRLRAGLLADLAVDREHRTVAPALRLVREVKTWALGELDLAYGFPNQHAQGVFKRVGYTALGAMTRYVRVLRHESYLGRIGEAELVRVPSWLRPTAASVIASEGWPRQAAAGVVDVAQLARDARRLASARRRTRLSTSEAAPAGLDALWRRCAVEHTVVAVRSARVLAWRYPAQPGRWWAAARQGSRLDAYAIVDQIDDVVHVRDLFGGRTAVAALLPQLVFEAYRRGASSISMRYLGDAWMSELLRAARFEPRSADRMIFVGVAPRLERRLQTVLANPACWFLTDFDEDV